MNCITTHRGFIEGLTDYANNQNYQLDTNDIIGDTDDFMSFYNYSFDETDTWDDYKDYIDSGRLVVIQLGGFFDQYYVVLYKFDIIISENVDNVYYNGVYWDVDEVTYQYSVYEGLGFMHTVIGYGYVEYTYYGVNSTRKDQFAVVSWGGANSYDYALIASDSAVISQAYSVYIYPSSC